MCEPVQSDLQKIVAVFKEVVSKVEDATMQGILKKFTGVWIELIQSACALISANAQLTSVASMGPGHIEQFFSANGLEKLKIVVGLRRKLVTCQNKLDVFSEDDRASDAYCDLLCTRMPQAFETELQSESFNDLAGHHAAMIANSLGERLTSLMEAVAEKRKKKNLVSEMPDKDWLLQWGHERDNDWTKLLPEVEAQDQLTLKHFDDVINETIWNIPALDSGCEELLQ